MNRFARWVVKHRVVVVIICLALMIPSIFGMASTRVKYDLLYYLPEELDTIKGQNILMEDFGKGAFSLCITEGLNEVDQADLEESIRGIPHVDTVVGYASALNGSIPSEILPDDIRGRFENGNDRIIAVFFDDTSSAEGTMEAITEIRRVAGEKCFVSGLSAVVTDTKALVEEQEGIYVAIAVALCCVVLMLTMDSFLLPLIFLCCIGVSILWNMGSNYLMGEISYITKAVAAVLQLAVTLDYSIFLWHSYKEQKTLCSDRDDAMAAAIGQTFSSIVGSSLTTVAGFVAICFMSFTLGRDLGIVMSKGVILGVLGTVILLPCVIRILDRALEKTSHKPLLPSVAGISKFVTKHYKVLFVVLIVLCIPAFYGYNNVGKYYDMSACLPQELESVKANTKLSETFDVSTNHLVLVDADVPQKDVVAMTDEMTEVDGVKQVLSIDSLLGAGIPESIVPDEILSELKSDEYQLMLISSEYIISSDAVNRQIDELNEILKKYDEGGMLIGEAPGEQESLMGRPFVGKAGKNLDHFLALVGLVRGDIYITNVVKFRPTKTGATGRLSNRPPTREEIALFRPWLMAEIARVNPGVIATLGNVPLQAVTDSRITIGEAHGRLTTAGETGRPLFPLYHPASLIYNRALAPVYEQDVRALADMLRKNAF